MYKLKECFECIIDLDFIFWLGCHLKKIMDDVSLLMWICFMMKHEMAMTITPPLVEGFSSSIIVAP
jgi:hypothetical protein